MGIDSAWSHPCSIACPNWTDDSMHFVDYSFCQVRPKNARILIRTKVQVGPVPSLELSLEPPRAFLVHVSHSLSVGLRSCYPISARLNLAEFSSGSRNRLFDPTGSTNENRMECFGVMSCGKSASIRTRSSGSG